MSLSESGRFEGIADIAYKVAEIFFPINRDSALTFEDFLQEILIKLSKECFDHTSESALMWKIASEKAIDLLRYGNRRAHPSLNTPVEDGEGGVVEWVEIYYRRENDQGTQEIEELLVRVAFEQSTPPSFQQVVYKRIAGDPLTSAERQRLSRIKRRIDVTFWEELFGIEYQEC